MESDEVDRASPNTVAEIVEASANRQHMWSLVIVRLRGMAQREGAPKARTDTARVKVESALAVLEGLDTLHSRVRVQVDEAHLAGSHGSSAKQRRSASSLPHCQLRQAIPVEIWQCVEAGRAK